MSAPVKCYAVSYYWTPYGPVCVRLAPGVKGAAIEWARKAGHEVTGRANLCSVIGYHPLHHVTVEASG